MQTSKPYVKKKTRILIGVITAVYALFSFLLMLILGVRFQDVIIWFPLVFTIVTSILIMKTMSDPTHIVLIVFAQKIVQSTFASLQTDQFMVMQFVIQLLELGMALLIIRMLIKRKKARGMKRLLGLVFSFSAIIAYTVIYDVTSYGIQGMIAYLSLFAFPYIAFMILLFAIHFPKNEETNRLIK